MLHGKQKMRSAVGYVRVSTGKQERSGLGLQAQQAALMKFTEAEGFALVETMVETESARPMTGRS